MTVDTVSRN